nr:hypothetical protein [Tanacetum cinerariifolium]
MNATPHLSQPQISHSLVSPSQQYQSHMDDQTLSVPQIDYHSPQVSTQPMTEFPQLDSGLAILVFTHGDDPIACLNKAMAFLSAIAASRFPFTNNQLRASSNPRNQAIIKDDRLLCNNFKGGKDKVMLVLAIRVMLLVPGEIIHEGKQGLLNVIIVKVKDTWLGNPLSLRGQGMLYDLGIPDGQAAQTTILNNAAFQIEDLDAYDSNCDDVSNAKVVLMANLSNYGSYVILEVPHSEPYRHEMDNQSVHAMQDFEQTPVVDFLDNEITSDSNIIPYS